MKLPHCKIIFCNNKEKKEGMLVAGGRAPDLQWLKTVSANKTIICADKGVTYCKQADIVPAYLVGDGDSALLDFDWAEESGVFVKRYSVDKEETDLQLALTLQQELADVDALLVTGIWGGRFDHSYSAIFSLCQYAKQTGVKTILADQQEIMILCGSDAAVKVEFIRRPEVISILPLSEQVQVSLQGCRWELDKKIIEQSNPYAISNRLKDAQKEITFTMERGWAGLYISFVSL